MGTEDTKVTTLFSCGFVNLVISHERKNFLWKKESGEISPSRRRPSVISWTADVEDMFLLHFVQAFEWLGHPAALSQKTAFFTHELKMIKNNSFPLTTHMGCKIKMSLENYCFVRVTQVQFPLQEKKKQIFYLEFARTVIRMSNDCWRSKQLMSVSSLQKPKSK